MGMLHEAMSDVLVPLYTCESPTFNTSEGLGTKGGRFLCLCHFLQYPGGNNTSRMKHGVPEGAQSIPSLTTMEGILNLQCGSITALSET